MFGIDGKVNHQYKINEILLSFFNSFSFVKALIVDNVIRSMLH